MKLIYLTEMVDALNSPKSTVENMLPENPCQTESMTKRVSIITINWPANIPGATSMSLFLWGSL